MLTNIKISNRFEKYRYSLKFWQEWRFSKKFYQNEHFRKFGPKSRFSENLDQDTRFLKILYQIRDFRKKIEIYENFDRTKDFCFNSTKIDLKKNFQ